MCMCFMQEARLDSVSVSSVWNNARFDHWVTRVSRALVRFLLLGGGSPQTVPKRSQTTPSYAETGLEKRKEPTNPTSHVKIMILRAPAVAPSNKRNKLSERCIIRCVGYTHSSIYSSTYPIIPALLAILTDNTKCTNTRSHRGRRQRR